MGDVTSLPETPASALSTPTACRSVKWAGAFGSTDNTGLLLGLKQPLRESFVQGNVLNTHEVL